MNALYRLAVAGLHFRSFMVLAEYTCGFLLVSKSKAPRGANSTSLSALLRDALPILDSYQPPRTLKFGPKFSFNNGWANCFADSTMDTAAGVETDLGRSKPGLPTVLLEREYVLPSPEWSTLYRVLALDA